MANPMPFTPGLSMPSTDVSISAFSSSKACGSLISMPCCARFPAKSSSIELSCFVIFLMSSSLSDLTLFISAEIVDIPLFWAQAAQYPRFTAFPSLSFSSIKIIAAFLLQSEHSI